MHRPTTYILVLENLEKFMEIWRSASSCWLFSTDAFMEYSDGKLEVTGPNATAQIFATYPAPYLSLVNGFADQVSAHAILILLN